MKCLITGASGFIGGFAVEEALRRGMEVAAGVRRTSSLRHIDSGRVEVCELDLSDEEGLRSALGRIRPDYIIHCAGVTKCADAADFYRVNCAGTLNLARAAVGSGIGLKRFVFLSSLSVMGPVAEAVPHRDITPDDEPQPDTAYGRSKLEAERGLAQIEGLDYVILRPTGVYGPRERDYMMMIDSIRSHVDFAAGWEEQDLTFVYVADVVAAAFLALTRGRTGAAYTLSDGAVYTSRTFSDLIILELGHPLVLRLKAPLWLLRAICAAGGLWGRLTGRVTALNADKYRIMRQRNWRCDISRSRDELGYRPAVGLSEGVRRTVKWRLENR